MGAVGTYWDCGSPFWGCARRPVVQASIVLGALGPPWDGARCAHTAGFCHISPVYFGSFPILIVFLTTSLCPNFALFPCSFILFPPPIFSVISSTVAPSRAQISFPVWTSASQYRLMPSPECDPGLQDDVTMAQSPIPVYPTSSQCLSTPPVFPVAPQLHRGPGMGQARLVVQ